MFGQRFSFAGLLAWLRSISHRIGFWPTEREKTDERQPLSFRSLEPRRVLSVNATFVAGVLDVAIQDDGGNTDATLLADGDEFFVDADGDQLYDDGTSGAAELRGLISELTQLNVTGDAGIGIFLWRDDFSAANINAAVDSVAIKDVQSAEITATVAIDGDVNVSAQDEIQFGGNLDIGGNLIASTTTAAGQILGTADSTLHVDGNANLTAASVTIGTFANDSATFGSLTFNVSGSVEVREDNSSASAGTILTGMNSAGNFDLQSDGSIVLDSSSSLTVSQGLLLQATGTGADIEIHGMIQGADDHIRLEAADRVEFGAAGNISSSGLANVSVQANGDGIFMADGSSVIVDSGSIQFIASSEGSGEVTLGQLSTSNSSAGAVEIFAFGNILDGTVNETANIFAAIGGVRFTSVAGGIGVSLDSIDIDAQRLMFDAASATDGTVNIADLSGGISVTEVSQAGGGVKLAANSPLAISASITVGASSTFTAGNSASSGDSLTLNHSAVVTLNSATDATVTFNAGDDIVFSSGSIVTTGGGNHKVELLADLDHSGVGALDGDRGEISQDGTSIVEVITDNLIANAGEGIALDTNAEILDAVSTLSGDIIIGEVDNILLQTVTTASGSIDVTAGGSILGVSLRAQGVGANVDLVSMSGDVTFSLAASIVADKDVNIDVLTGDMFLGTAIAQGGNATLTAGTGDIAIGFLSAQQNIFVTSSLGSINDLHDDAFVDIVAGNVITLDAQDSIGGLGADNKLELASGSNVTATTRLGDINLRGVGALTLADVRAEDGAIDIMAAGTVAAVNVDSSITDSNSNDISITTSSGDVVISKVRAGGLQGDVSIIADGNITDGDTLADDIDVEANDITLIAQNGSIGGTFASLFKGAVDALEVKTNASAGDAGNPGELVATAVGGSIALNADLAGSSTVITNSLYLASDGDLDAATLMVTSHNLALIADADANGVGTLTLGTTISVAGDLRVEAAEVTASGGTIDLNAERLLFKSGQAQVISVTVQQFDGETNGDLTISSDSAAFMLADLDCDLSAIDVGNHTATLNQNSRAIVSQELPSDSTQDSRILAGSLVLSGLGNFELTNGNNDTNVLAGSNVGEITFKDIDDVIIDAVGSTNGLNSGNGDVLIDVGSSLTINQPIIAGTGNVRLQSSGNISQSSTGIITADQLSVRQSAGTGEVRLAAGNDVNTLAISNLGHSEAITFSDVDDLTIGLVTSAAVRNVTFDATQGIHANNGDILLDAGAALSLTQQVTSGTANVRLMAANDITQTSLGIIEADELGVRQTGTSGNVILDDANTVNSLATFNNAVGGRIAFKNTQALLIDTIAAEAVNGVAFAATTGTSSTDGDLLIDVDGALTLNQQLNAGRGDARLIVQGDLTQLASGVVIANDFGILQQALGGIVRLESLNDVDTLSAQNDASNGSIAFNDINNVTISAVVEQMIGNLSFAQTTGLVTQGGNILMVATEDIVSNSTIFSNSGHITLQAGDDIDLNAAITTGGAGSVYLNALNANLVDSMGPDVDGINVNGSIRSEASILIDSANEIQLTELVQSFSEDIGLVADGNILQSAAVFAFDQVGVHAGGDMTMAFNTVIQAREVLLQTLGSMNLGLISATSVAIEADGDIATSNAFFTNVDATTLLIRADGSIGGAYTGNGSPNTNANAILLTVDTLAASSGSGIYVADATIGGALVIGHVAALDFEATVEHVRFDSTLTSVERTQHADSLDDLETVDGAIKVRVQNRSLTIEDGLDADGLGVSAGGSGDVLLFAQSDIITKATISSDTGNVTLEAVDDVFVNASVGVRGTGSIYIQADNLVRNDAAIPEVDGINIHATVSSVAGSIGIQSQQDIFATANVTATGSTADIGLLAGGNIFQQSNITAGRNLLLVAEQDIDMGAGIATTANGDVLLDSGGDLQVGLVSANRASLKSGGDITDTNEDNSANIIATSLSMVAGGIIGGPDSANGIPDENVHAIDLEVELVAAHSATGIYLQELAMGGDLTVGHIDSFNVQVDVVQANFNSTTSSRFLGEAHDQLDDLTTSFLGPIKVVVRDGGLTIEDGQDQNGRGVFAELQGDILLKAAGDIAFSGGISTADGQITIVSGDDVVQNADVQTGRGVVYVSADNVNLDRIGSEGVIMGDNTATRTINGFIRIDSQADIVLGFLDTVDNDASTGAVSLFASAYILDGSDDLAELNIQSGALRIQAGGGIGLADSNNGTPNVNLQAIDTQVQILAAHAGEGIYIHETDGLTIGPMSDLTGGRANFNSTTSIFTDVAMPNLTSEQGPIKVQSDSGTLDITVGDTDGVGIRSGTDVLLQVLSADGEIVAMADILGQGSIALEAGDDIMLANGVDVIGNTSVSLFAGNQTADSVKGIMMEAGSSVSTNGGNVRMVAGNEGDIQLSSIIIAGRSGDGYVSLAAEGSILDHAAQETLAVDASAGQDLLKVSRSDGFRVGDYVFVEGANQPAELHRIADVVAGELMLENGLSSSYTAGLQTTISVVNIITSSDLRIVADATIDSDGSIAANTGNGVGAIGTADPTAISPDRNGRAIDTVVTTIAAHSAEGIYIQEFDDLVIGETRVFTELKPRFNSQLTVVSDASLSDLTTTNGGSIKAVSLTGSISVTAGTDSNGLGLDAQGAGDILLVARGAASNIVIASDAAINSGTGNVSLFADRDITVQATIQAGGTGSVYTRAGNDITTTGMLQSSAGDLRFEAARNISLDGDIASLTGSLALFAQQDGFIGSTISTSGDAIIQAERDIVMSNDSVISVGENLLMVAGSEQVEGTQTLGLLESTHVALQASGDIFDGNGSDLANVRASSLRMIADSNQNQSGGVGNSNAAIDLELDTISVLSSQGIYLQQLAAGGDLTIGHVDAISASVHVQQVNFDSTTTSISSTSELSGLDDLETLTPRIDGERAIELRVQAGDLVVTDGMDSDHRGVVVEETGSILLSTTQAGSIAIQTGIETAGIHSGGNITLAASGWIDELSQTLGGSASDASIVGESLTIIAGQFAHLHNTTVNSLDATVGSNGQLDSAWQQTNAMANDRGDDFLDALGEDRIDSATQSGVLVEASPDASMGTPDLAAREAYEDIARQFRFADTYQGHYALFMQNTKTLEVTSVVAGSSIAPNVYIETLGQSADLNVGGSVLTVSENATEGGIVLVAGNELNLEGQLATVAQPSPGMLRTQLIDIVGETVQIDASGQPQVAYLNAAAYNGGEGVPPRDFSLTSTEFVVRDQQLGLSALAEDYRSHVFQRVVMQFGYEGESGFVSLVGYADGEVQQFDVAGEEGVLTKSFNALDRNDQTAILAQPRNVLDAAAFTRGIAFDNSFLDANQMLPTTAIVRRAADFFLFENAAADDPADIRDMTFETFEILDVVALGAQGTTEVPREVERIAPPEIRLATPTDITPNPTQAISSAMELAITQERSIEVAIYRVFYEDENLNGQAETSELPASSDILEADVSDSNVSESDAPEVARGKRLKLETIRTETGGSPTVEDIEKLKNRYLNDPQQPAGAYAVIEKGVDDEEIILDVFSIRDIDEPVVDSQKPIISRPKDASSAPGTMPPETQGREVRPSSSAPEMPSDTEMRFQDTVPGERPPSSGDNAFHASQEPQTQLVDSSRFADSKWLAGSIWFATTIASKRGRGIVEDINQQNNNGQPTEFGRRARRNRRLSKNQPE